MFIKMTNYLCLLSALVLVAYDDEEKWTVKTTRDGLELYNDCIKMLNIPADEVPQIKSISDPLNRRILKCVYNAIGFYTEGRGFRVDRIVKQFGGGSVMQKIVKNCIPTRLTDRVDVQIVEFEECFKLHRVGGYQDCIRAWLNDSLMLNRNRNK